MKDIHALIAYLRDELPTDNIHQSAIILHLLEHGGRATRTDLIRRLAEFSAPVRFYYESVLSRETALDLANKDAFTYDSKTDNYFLNVSLLDTFLVETATRMCRAKINQWQDLQHQRTEPDTKGGSKLVRDRIPEMISAEGRVPQVTHIRGETLQMALLEKLSEEHLELLIDTNLNEISDMIEVLLALAKGMGHDEASVMRAVHEKRTERGAFDDGVYLLSIESEQAEIAS